MVDYPEFLKSHRVMLAPMAGVSDAAMRQLCVEQGAQLTFTEMVSAKGLSYANKRTCDLLVLAANEQQVGVQLFGHEPEVMAQEAAWLNDALGDKLALIDINMGCPARKIVTKGDGSSLMQRPDEAKRIIEAVVAAVDVPVTVKIRRGFKNECENAPEFAVMAQDAGAAGVTVHGRYAEQLYRGSSDKGVIARVKQTVSIPVVGNGDITNGEDASSMMRETGCDAVMIARAAQGNPWIFAQVLATLEGRPAPAPPTPTQRIEMARRQARLLAQSEPKSVVRMRKQACWYCKGLPGASTARLQLNACSTLEDFEGVFDMMIERQAIAESERN